MLELNYRPLDDNDILYDVPLSHSVEGFTMILCEYPTRIQPSQEQYN
jgi:hypothetical protein